MPRLNCLAMTNVLILVAAATMLSVPARADAVTDELQQDEQAYNALRQQLSADQLAGNAAAQAGDQHRYRLAILKLRVDRGIITGPNEHEHQEKQGRSKP